MERQGERRKYRRESPEYRIWSGIPEGKTRVAVRECLSKPYLKARRAKVNLLSGVGTCREDFSMTNDGNRSGEEAE